MIRPMALTIAAAMLASCATGSIKREIGLVAPLPVAQCPAESAVDWGAYTYYDFDAIEAGFAEDAAEWGWPETAENLTGDDVNIRFHISANVHVSRVNQLRAFRRDGVWTVETSERESSGYPFPPPPPDAEPGSVTALQCYPDSVILRGGMGDRLQGAVEAFLADGCRSRIPILSPAPMFLKDADGIGCEDGASAHLQIETADGVERYIQRCAVPGSTLGALIAALEGERSPVDPEALGVGRYAVLTVEEFFDGGNQSRACRAKAELLFPDMAFDAPWRWCGGVSSTRRRRRRLQGRTPEGRRVGNRARGTAPPAWRIAPPWPCRS